MCLQILIDIINMYKEGLALNNLQWLICHKTKPNQTKPNFCSTLISSQLAACKFFKSIL